MSGMKFRSTDEEMVVRDVCCMLPYGVRAEVFSYWNNTYVDDDITGIDMEEGDFICRTVPGKRCEFGLVKPYLRRMTDMTADEWAEFENWVLNEKDPLARHANGNIFFGTHHLDHLGLIDMGLAKPAPEGMYK